MADNIFLCLTGKIWSPAWDDYMDYQYVVGTHLLDGEEIPLKVYLKDIRYVRVRISMKSSTLKRVMG